MRHAEALDAVTRYLGQGSYLNWDEETRVSWLLKELNEKRPLLPSVHGAHGGGGSYSALGSMFDETVCDTLGTFDMIAQMPPESLGAYVISMAQQASDVLAVRLLQAGLVAVHVDLLQDSLRMLHVDVDIDRKCNAMQPCSQQCRASGL